MKYNTNKADYLQLFPITTLCTPQICQCCLYLAFPELVCNSQLILNFQALRKDFNTALNLRWPRLHQAFPHEDAARSLDHCMIQT